MAEKTCWQELLVCGTKNQRRTVPVFSWLSLFPLVFSLEWVLPVLVCVLPPELNLFGKVLTEVPKVCFTNALDVS